MAYDNIAKDMKALVEQWVTSDILREGDLFVIGCSTSEVAGEHIGTSGNEQIAEIIFNGLQELQGRTGVRLAFQCCEHLNRAIVLERETATCHHLDEVTVVPVPTAGGAMASFAYRHLKDPVVVEHIKADAGMDIGEVMIGMHLKHVAVPLRFGQRNLGSARVNGARTRPKLIGGSRASYENPGHDN